MKINPKTIQLDRVLKKAISDIKPLAKEKNIKLVYQPSKKINDKLATDVSLLQKVIKDLLTNAVIYSTSKKPEVIINLKKENANEYVISIKDNGIGVPKLDQEKIFTKFFRSENALKVHTEGVGINLSVAKYIINSLGGRIWLESKLNKGTVFYISLPSRPPKERSRLS